MHPQEDHTTEEETGGGDNRKRERGRNEGTEAHAGRVVVAIDSNLGAVIGKEEEEAVTSFPGKEG